MKIALVFPFWRFSVPPDDLFVSVDVIGCRLAEGLARSEEVFVYVHRSRMKAPVVVHNGVTYRGVSVLFDRVVARGLGILDRLRKSAGLHNVRRPPVSWRVFFLGYVLQAALDIRRRRCDVVHVFVFEQHAATIKALNPNTKVVLHLHDNSQRQRDPKMTARRLARCDHIVGISHFVTDRLQSGFPDVADRCTTIHNGVDIDMKGEILPRQRDDTTLRVLYVGRVAPEKGIHVITAAFDRLVREGLDVVLDLIGPSDFVPIEFVDPLGDEPHLREVRHFYDHPEDYLQSLRDSLCEAAAGRFHVRGTVMHDNLASHYSRADVFVFPTVIDEPFGLPVAEAMSFGLPVVATRSGALPEMVIDGKTGLLVEKGDADALAAAIRTVLMDDALRAAMGVAGAKRAREMFSWERFIERWLDQYRAIAACAPSAPMRQLSGIE